jgi:hypothetical protein
MSPARLTLRGELIADALISTPGLPFLRSVPKSG